MRNRALNVFVVLVQLLLLCRCASKHQPIEFPPYFPTRPQSFVGPEELREIAEYEDRDDLSLFEKRKLNSLYGMEARRLKPGSPRYETIKTRMADLAPDLTGYESEMRELQTETKQFRERAEDSPFRWTNALAKREYQAAFQLWNKDETEQALTRIQQTLTNEKLKGDSTTQEWIRLLSTRYRIALELRDMALIVAAYEEMRRYASCDPETAQAGFLTALQFFLQENHASAARTFSEQCDPDTSANNRIRRLYWEARFNERETAFAKAKYEEIVNSGVPGYYFYLAHSRLNRKLDLGGAASLNTRSYLGEPLELPGKVAELLLNAEDRLQKGLRRDAGLYLMRASQILRSGVNRSSPAPLLYTAHLLQAAGSQLEAMKIYSVVSSDQLLLAEEKLPSERVDYLREMFPTPHLAEVEWFGSQWKVDPDFIYALMRQESAFNPAAVSYMDARGLMQLMPFLARSIAQQWRYHGYYNDRLLFHARENLKIAVFHLHTLQTTLPHPALVAAAYNAGLNRALNWWRRQPDAPLDVFVELIPINETRNYVKLVLRNLVHYRLVRSGGVLDPKVFPFVLPILSAAQFAG